MDFSLTEEQRLLADSAAKLAASHGGVGAARKAAQSGLGFDPAFWDLLAAQGWTALPFPAADGGLDGGPVEVMLVMEAMGRALATAPLISNVILAGGLVARAPESPLRRQLLAGMTAGTARAAACLSEPQAGYDLQDIAVTVSHGGVPRLSGLKTGILDAAGSDHLLVTARTAGTRRDPAGIGLYHVAPGAPGVVMKDAAGLGGGRVASIHFTETPAEPLLAPDGAWPVIMAAADDAAFALAADAMGTMDALLRETIDYVTGRRQFDRPVGSFQTVKHRLVEAFMDLEQVRSLLYLTAAALSDGSNAERPLSALKAQMAAAAKNLGETAIQLHGGMGMTDEISPGWRLRRLMRAGLLFGDQDHYTRRFIGAER